MRLFLARHAFPLAVGTITVVFLGLFFLLPVLKVFDASVLDASGKSFTVYTHWSRGLPWFFANSDAPDATTTSLVIFGWLVWAFMAAAAVAGVRAGFSHQKESS